jgi:hypothetical protein
MNYSQALLLSFILECIAFSDRANAQTFNEKDFGIGEGRSIDTAANGNYIIGANVAGSAHMILIDQNMDTIRTISDTNFYLYGVKQLENNGWITCGDSAQTAIIIRTDSLGNHQGTNYFPSAYFGSSASVAGPGRAGGYYAMYSDDDIGNQNPDYFVLLDSSGNLIRTTQLAFNGGNEFQGAIETTTDSGWAIACRETYTLQTKLFRLNAADSILWSYYYYDTTFAGGFASYGISELRDGGFIVCGAIDQTNLGLLYKINGTGSIQWEKRYDFASTGITLIKAYETNSNGFFIAGNIRRPNNLNGIILMQTDSVGDTLWTREFYGNGRAFCNAMIADNNGFPMIIGSAIDTLINEWHIHLIHEGSIASSIPSNKILPFGINETNSHGIFRIRSEANLSIRVFTMTGRLVLTKNSRSEELLDLSTYSSGLYLIRLEDKSGRVMMVKVAL